MTRILQIISHSEEQTEALGRKLAARFKPGELILLTGKLGAGKTAFVRGLAAGLGLDADAVNSPTYTIVNEYPGPTPLYHFDLYRIGDPSELYEVGWDDYANREGLMVIEWGERAEELLSAKYIQIFFKVVSANEREITIEAAGDA